MALENPVLKQIRENPGMRLCVFFGSFFILLIVASIISAGIDKLPFGDIRAHMLISAIVQCVLVFCLPAFILAKYAGGNYLNWLKLSKAPQLRAILGVILVYIISLPAMEWLVEWNKNIHFPEALGGLEQIFRSWENSSEESTKILLDSTGFFPVLAGVLVIGLLTGFSEELFFRGGLQQVLNSSSKKADMAVWMSAFIFSVMHFQFFGFFPRLLMGAFFGYLLIWTKSIWVPIFAHALNNSMVVITAAITGNPEGALDDLGEKSVYFDSPYAIIISFALTIIFLMVCRKDVFKIKNKENMRWQKNQLQRTIGKS